MVLCVFYWGDHKNAAFVGRQEFVKLVSCHLPQLTLKTKNLKDAYKVFIGIPPSYVTYSLSCLSNSIMHLPSLELDVIGERKGWVCPLASPRVEKHRLR